MTTGNTPREARLENLDAIDLVELSTPAMRSIMEMNALPVYHPSYNIQAIARREEASIDLRREYRIRGLGVPGWLEERSARNEAAIAAEREQSLMERVRSTAQAGREARLNAPPEWLADTAIAAAGDFEEPMIALEVGQHIHRGIDESTHTNVGGNFSPNPPTGISARVTIPIPIAFHSSAGAGGSGIAFIGADRANNPSYRTPEDCISSLRGGVTPGRDFWDVVADHLEALLLENAELKEAVKMYEGGDLSE